jgi:hypothetical protein
MAGHLGNPEYQDDHRQHTRAGMPASNKKADEDRRMKATPMTFATARMVAVDSLESRPAAPAKRSKMARVARLPALPKAMMMPATMKAARNCRSWSGLATKPSAALARLPTRLHAVDQAGRSVYAADQIA